MKVKIKPKRFTFLIPFPLFAGEIAIKCISKEQMSKEEKEVALQCYKYLKRTLKEYKGLEILNVETKDGMKINIRV